MVLELRGFMVLELRGSIYVRCLELKVGTLLDGDHRSCIKSNYRNVFLLVVDFLIKVCEASPFFSVSLG